jgi:hypothetical protein
MVGFGALSVIFTLACAAFRPDSPIIWIDLALLFGGVFRSLQFTALNTIAYADVPRARMSAATSFYATFQQITLTLGISLAAGTLDAASAITGHASPTVSDFSIAFILVSLIGAIAVPISARLSPQAGDDISGHHAPPPPVTAVVTAPPPDRG